MAKKVLVFLADGFEEVEAVTPVDYLRRAGIEVTTVSVTGNAAVRGVHGVVLNADVLLENFLDRLSAGLWDAVSIPGGMPGAANLAACPEVGSFYRAMAGAGKIIAAICASPAVALAPLGLLDGKKFTCYPGMESRLTAVKGSTLLEEKVVIDGNLITSRGPGTAADYALALITVLAGEQEADKLRRDALL
jgi:4-methyl-5(b-hydroxyethyl)-thiazole monophosphate biosynthesis